MAPETRAASLPSAGTLTRPVQPRPGRRLQPQRLVPVREDTMLLSESPLPARAVRAALPLRVALAASVLICPALARDDGRFSHLPTDVRDWFRSQKSPVSGEHCCDEADGTWRTF